MPKKPIDYQNTIIYKIQHIDNPELLYVGSTVDFVKRKYNHKSDCGNPKKNHKKVYTMINQNGGWDMFNMVELYKFPCENKRQAECEEDRCMREINATLNKNRAFTTIEDTLKKKKEYYEHNKKQILEKCKHYREQNKEKVSERIRKHYEQNRDKILDQQKHRYQENKKQILEKCKHYRELHKEQRVEYDKHYRELNKEKIAEYKKCYSILNKDKLAKKKKQYYELNKQQLVEQQKQYYEQNKERITERRKEKVICECGCVSTKRHLMRHKRSKNHQDRMKSIEQ